MKKSTLLLMAVCLWITVPGAWADSNWDNDGGSGDGLWRTASNWDAGVPTTADKAGIRAGVEVGPTIDSSTAAVTKELVCGDWGHTDNFEIIGGSLTTNGWFILGYGASDDGTFNVSGGTTTVNSHMDLGFKGAGQMHMTDGMVTVTGTFGISLDNDGAGTSSGDLQLDGGTISCGSFIMKNGGSMDITNGTLIVNGDVAAAIDGYISSGWITAHGGSGTVEVDTAINPGKTTVTAFIATEPPTKASDPIPSHGATDVSTNPTLSWIPGLHASSHDVYFGTNPTPGAGQFQGNQTIGTFNPGSLELDTIYYWRIDEKNTLGTATGDVWSFTTTADSTYSLVGKVMCGYQGWFNAPGDGTPYNFRHWGQNGNFTPVDCSIDFWPDMTEFSPSEKFLVSSFNDGKDRYVFSSHNYGTVLRHFQWMYDYGIDGVYLQRFTSEITPGSTMFNERNTVLDYCKAGANIYGRKYAVMYDLSGTGSAAEIEEIKDDWKYLVDTKQVGKDPADDAYMTHGGKPVVALWGYGFKRVYEGQESHDLIDWFKNDPVYGGNIVMLGVEPNWVTNKNNKTDYPWLEDTLLLADIISPWRVGRAKNTGDVNSWASGRGTDDQNWCDANSKEYLPVIFPGFSWYNHKDYTSPLNYIPRNGGQFLWDQVNACINTIGANMMYVAMFDEVDEGTAIFKVTNDPPQVLPAQFVTLDIDGYDVPSDEYLWLVGQATRGLRGEIPVNATRPERIECAGLADFNCDGNIDIEDLSYMSGVWLTGDTTADIAQPVDGIVNLLDFSVLAQEWTSNIEAHWAFDETTGSIAEDASPNSYDGTLMNMHDSDWVVGVNGNALDFDGIDDYIEVANYKGITGTQARTCTAWIKTDSVNKELMSWGGTGSGEKWLILINAAGILRVEVNNGNIYGTTNIADNNWHHIAVVLEDDGSPDVSEIQLYIDGALETIGGTADEPVNTRKYQNVQMGVCESQGFFGYFQGQMDDVRIHNRALSQAEITEIAQ